LGSVRAGARGLDMASSSENVRIGHRRAPLRDDGTAQAGER
jgi:hypothetical protein